MGRAHNSFTLPHPSWKLTPPRGSKPSSAHRSDRNTQGLMRQCRVNPGVDKVYLHCGQSAAAPAPSRGHGERTVIFGLAPIEIVSRRGLRWIILCRGRGGKVRDCIHLQACSITVLGSCSLVSFVPLPLHSKWEWGAGGGVERVLQLLWHFVSCFHWMGRCQSSLCTFLQKALTSGCLKQFIFEFQALTALDANQKVIWTKGRMAHYSLGLHGTKNATKQMENTCKQNRSK